MLTERQISPGSGVAGSQVEMWQNELCGKTVTEVILPENGDGFRAEPNEGRELQAVTKVVVGIHVLPMHPLFGDDIPRRLPRRVSLVKPTSVPSRF